MSNHDLAQPASPMSAADHCLAAEKLFARARELQPKLEQDAKLAKSGAARGYDQRVRGTVSVVYAGYMEWAYLHLRFAEVITQGANLVADYRLAKANLDTNMHRTHVGSEADDWDDFVGGRLVGGHSRAPRGAYPHLED